jgi:hypothetical protein
VVLPPRRVIGLGAAPTAAQALAMSPAQLLAIIDTGWSAPGVSLQSQTNIQSLLDGQFANLKASWVTAENAKAKAMMQVAGAVLIATGVLAPFGVALEGLSAFAADIAKFFAQYTIDLSGPNQTCSPVNWPANFYYAANPPNVASATPIASLPPIAPIVPGTLRALLIPPLCQAFADVENCRLLDPNSTGSVAFMSNIWIASMVYAWNAGAVGFATDYFVPFIPSGPAVNNRWSGWGPGGGVTTRDWYQWGWPPPFVIPGQGKYAFQPLSQVPTSIADPSTEWKPGSQNAVGYPWSRIRANTPPFLNVIQKAGAVSGLAAAGVGIYAMATRQSFLSALKSIYAGATSWL